jgi:hypothetical protein
MCDAPGVPCSVPLVGSNAAHVGRFAIENVNAFPSGSDAVGVNVYRVPCVAVGGGEPVIAGGRFVVGAVTTIENAASVAVFGPSLTEILMLLNVPVVPLGGVPDSRPVRVSNAAQPG